MAGDNRTLGRFQLTGIPPAPRGVPQIEVTFDIDANGILNVSAKDLGTGKEQSIEIKASSGLSEEEVKRMVKDAEAHAAEDEKKKKLIDLRNQADHAIYTTEKTLKEHGGKVDASVRAEIEQAINRLKDAQKSDDARTIESAMENLTQVSFKLGEAVYRATGKRPEAEQRTADVGAGRGGGSAGGKSDDVIDAEYEVKNDK